MVKKKKRAICCFLMVLMQMVLIAGCTMPRVMILDDPLSPEEHLRLGLAYEKDGELDNAIREYRAAAKRLPGAYFYLGNAHFQKNELDQAEKYYKRAIKEDSQNADAHNNLAWLYFVRRTNLDEAEKLVLKAIELNPSNQLTYEDTLEKVRDLKGSIE